MKYVLALFTLCLFATACTKQTEVPMQEPHETQQAIPAEQGDSVIKEKKSTEEEEEEARKRLEQEQQNQESPQPE